MTSNGLSNGHAKYEALPNDDHDTSPPATKLVSTGHDTSLANSAVFPVASYCLSSILMTVINKYCVSGRRFTMNLLVLTIQAVVCTASVLLIKRAGVISFRDFDMVDAKKWFPISFLLVSVLYTGSKSLQYLSIPVYTIFKNLTIILIAYGEVLWFGGRVTSLTLGSFLLMVLSSIIAAWSDISNSLSSWSETLGSSSPPATSLIGKIQSHIGYLWMAVNCLTTAVYVLSMRKRIKLTQFKDWDTTFYNNLLCVPVLAIFSFVLEDWGTESLARNFPPETRTALLSAIAFSGAAAVGISYTTAWCVRVTSSTTYSMVGALNKLPIALSGIVFFGDVASLGSISAIAIGFVGGVVYAIAKNNQKKEDSLKERGAGNGIIPMHSLRRP